MNFLEHPALKLFSDLLVPSPSGREWDLAAVVRGKLEALGYAHRTDSGGNVLVEIPGSELEAPLVCFASHIDEIAVDGSPMPPETRLALDGRPGIWTKDKLAVYDPRLVRAFMDAALAAGTELQPVVFASAASDASMVADSLGVPRIACVGHVRENSHGYEVIRLSVLDHLLETLVKFVETWRG